MGFLHALVAWPQPPPRTYGSGQGEVVMSAAKTGHGGPRPPADCARQDGGFLYAQAAHRQL